MITKYDEKKKTKVRYILQQATPDRKHWSRCDGANMQAPNLETLQTIKPVIEKANPEKEYRIVKETTTIEAVETISRELK